MIKRNTAKDIRKKNSTLETFGEKNHKENHVKRKRKFL